jgi:hypothetical protein
MSNSLYDRDFHAWATQQAELLRGGNLGAADIPHIAEELESMGASERRELVNRLRVLLLHMLKWRYQPSHRGRSWQLSIENARDELADHLEDNPSLQSELGISEAMQTAYRRARRSAERETGLSASTFPPECPWTFEQTMEQELKAGNE